jgi:signal peptidase I
VRVFRLLKEFAVNHRVSADRAGELFIPLRFVYTEQGPEPDFYQLVGGRTFFVFPTTKWQFSFGIREPEGEISYRELTFPRDFQLTDVLQETYFEDYDNLGEAMVAARDEGRLEIVPFQLTRADGTVVRGEERRIYVGRSVERGDLLVDFDVSTGDMLFVDRFSYHFVAPEVGDPIVFRTDRIPGERSLNEAGQWQSTEQYYIKRLVGLPGDTLRIDEPVLLRNGEPITGAKAFARNHAREGEYEGYQARGFLGPNDVQTIADGYFYAMGDNSDQSLDSRLWGFQELRAGLDKRSPDEITANVPLNQVPETEAVGRALLIFYPFTARVGPAE